MLLGNFTRKFSEHHLGISLACLVAADRYEHILAEILPELNKGKIVITDRYILSSLILQCMDNLKVFIMKYYNGILDDLFLRNAKSIDMANNIFSKFPKLSWRGMIHVLSLVNAIDKIKELQVGNCKELFIGIESGSESIRKKINKSV